MRRRVLVVVALVVVAFGLGTTSMAAIAYSEFLKTLKVDEIYIRPGGLPTDGNPTGMPGTTTGNGGDDGFIPSRALQSSQGQKISDGPVSISDGAGTVNRGSVLIGPTGGSVYSPKQRADREIKALIRQIG